MTEVSLAGAGAPELESRPATLADAINLSTLSALVFREAYQSAFDSQQPVADFITTNFSVEKYHAELVTDCASYSLGWVAGVQAGFLKLQSSVPPECVGCRSAIELAKLYILRTFHGTGIADLLMERALEQASRYGVSQVWLCVWQRNSRAIAFYRRWGFSAVGSGTFNWSGVEFRDFVMTRSLTSVATSGSRTKLDVPFANDAEIKQLVERFEACTWPYTRWTHRAHLAVGLFYIRSLTPAAALDRLRHHIQRYNAACGDPNGYNETVTVMFLRKLAAQGSDFDDGRPLTQIVEELTRECSVDWLYQYYSPDRIWSAEAKSRWLEPNIKPLDF